MKRSTLAATVLAPIVAVLAVGAFVPIRFESREELFEIPQGTWLRRQSGDLVDILPSEIRLVLGAHDVLVLRNLDDVPQLFGPTLIMPKQTFRLPFDVASDYQFACTAHVSGQMSVIVEDALVSPWSRLRWRVGRALLALAPS